MCLHISISHNNFKCAIAATTTSTSTMKKSMYTYFFAVLSTRVTKTCPQKKQHRRVVLSCLAFSCLVLSCHLMSCLVLSCLVMSCHVMSCLVLSCLQLLVSPFFDHFPRFSILPQAEKPPKLQSHQKFKVWTISFTSAFVFISIGFHKISINWFPPNIQIGSVLDFNVNCRILHWKVKTECVCVWRGGAGVNSKGGHVFKVTCPRSLVLNVACPQCPKILRPLNTEYTPDPLVRIHVAYLRPIRFQICTSCSFVALSAEMQMCAVPTFIHCETSRPAATKF